jgi:hypothetical protein
MPSGTSTLGARPSERQALKTSITAQPLLRASTRMSWLR